MGASAEYHREWRAKNRERIREQARARYAADPERHKAAHRKWYRTNPGQWLKTAYSLTEQQYSQMLVQQRGGCAICGVGNPPRLHVDHNHETKKVRGLLCKQCNMGLGLFKDDESRLHRAIAYLKERN